MAALDPHETPLIPLLTPLNRGRRLPRSGYNRLAIRLLLAAFGIVGVAILAASHNSRLMSLAIAGIGLSVVAGLAMVATVRRLHDRDRTGWWLLPNALATLAGFAPIETLADACPVAVVAATLVVTGFSLWFLIETMGRRGTPGPNRYGPQPES